MRKDIKRVAALALAAALALSGCGSGSTGSTGESSSSTTTGSESTSASQEAPVEDSTGAIKDLVTYELVHKEVESLNMLYSQVGSDSNVSVNLVEGLLSVDSKGRLVPALAQDWGTEDGGKTWKFQLRQGVKWVDVNGNEKADCTAWDFITGMEWILNYHKNEAANTSMPLEMITGAQEYYEYTKELPKEEALTMDNSKFLEMVGVEAPDDYTVIYHCVAEKPYFDTVATYRCLYPAPAALIEELGTDGFRGYTNETMWYNGAYLMTSFIHGNEKILTKNPAYWDTKSSRFDTVTVKIVDSLDVAYQLYQAGDIDHVDLSESILKTISENPNHEFYSQIVEKRPNKYSYQFHFNYDKRMEDGSTDENWNTAVANEAFRQSWYYGLNLVPYWQRFNAINPQNCEINTYTMSGTLYTSDGTDYTKLVTDRLNLKPSTSEVSGRFDAEKALAYKEQAIKELTAKGVTFPVEMDFYVAASNQTEIDNAAVLAQMFSDCLGDDFVKMNIKTFVSSQAKEVRTPRLQSFVVNAWGADYGDPQNFLGQETYGEDSAYYSVQYANINDATDEELIAVYQEFTDMVNKADTITDDLDARYAAYADAEVFMLEHALTVPAYIDVRWQLTRVNDYSKPYAMFGIQNYKYVGWDTSEASYTTEQYEEIKKASEAN